MNRMQALAERFCATPLPESICADLCATRQGPGRTGTNLLSVIEAREVLGAVLGNHVAELEQSVITMHKDCSAFSAERDRYREAFGELLKWAWHKDGCPCFDDDPEDPDHDLICTCGLNALIVEMLP